MTRFIWQDSVAAAATEIVKTAETSIEITGAWISRSALEVVDQPAVFPSWGATRRNVQRGLFSRCPSVHRRNGSRAYGLKHTVRRRDRYGSGGSQSHAATGTRSRTARRRISVNRACALSLSGNIRRSP